MEYLLKGWLLGLSTGTLCLTTCTPIYLPYIMSHKQGFWNGLKGIFEISIGRFFAYILFGAVAGFVGENIAAYNRALFTNIAYILLSIYLIFSTLNMLKHPKLCKLHTAGKYADNPIILGLITGLNFCPAFLIALSNAFISGTLNGAIFFASFFFGTSIFLIPIAFTSMLHKRENLRKLAYAASFLIAIWFLVIGTKGLYNMKIVNKSQKEVVNIFDSKNKVYMIFSKYDTIYIALHDSLEKKLSHKIPILYADNPAVFTQISNIPNQSFVIKNFSLYSENNSKYKNLNILLNNKSLRQFIVPDNYTIDGIQHYIELMRYYNFKIAPNKGFEWKLY